MPLVFRADYWKSQAKKYCDFCKCWLADNKPSVEFHEKGRKHQENVARRLKTITKQSTRDHKEAAKMDADLKKMESAALEAYRKDVENNADITSRSINEKLQEENLAIAEAPGSKKAEEGGGSKVWQETMSPDGNAYYWNILTNETVWEPPKEGYLSFADQKAAAENESLKQLQRIVKQRNDSDKTRLLEKKQEEEEERAAKEREKMKTRRIPEEETIVLPSPGPILPPGKTEPYGQWKTIRTNVVPVDFQLPEHSYAPEPTIIAEPEPKQREFKEKTIKALDGGGETSFKKRKGFGGAKRNVRQRLDDD